MDIDNPTPRKVLFIEEDPCQTSINWGNHADPKGLLEVGVEYMVKKIEVHSWHTRIFLEEFGDNVYFNSTWFKEVTKCSGQ